MNCAILLKALRDPRLTRTDLAILGALIRIEGPPLSRKEVAAEAGCAPSSVPRSARKLEELGYIEREIDTRDHGGRAKPTGYRLKSDTCQDGYVPAPQHSDADTLEIVDVEPKRPRPAPSRPEPDTGQIPPKDNNQTPQELNPEPVVLVATAVAEPMLLNGRAATMTAHELGEILFDRVNNRYLDPSRGNGSLSTSCHRIKAWQAAGADFDADIVETVQRVMARTRKPIRSLTYFDAAIAETIAAKRQALEPLELPLEASHDFAPRTTGNVHVSGGKISPASAHHMRAVKAARDADERRRMESGACK